MNWLTLFVSALALFSTSFSFAKERQFLMRETSEKMRLTFLFERELADASSIHHKMFQLNDFNETVLIFRNSQQETIAKAVQPFFSLSNTIQLVDVNENLLVSLKETSPNQYLISDAQHEIAKGRRVTDSYGNVTYLFYTLNTPDALSASKDVFQKKNWQDQPLSEELGKKKLEEPDFSLLNKPSASIQKSLYSSSNEAPVRWRLFISESNIIHPLLFSAIAALDTLNSYTRFYITAGTIGVTTAAIGLFLGYKRYKSYLTKKDPDPNLALQDYEEAEKNKRNEKDSESSTSGEDELEKPSQVLEFDFNFHELDHFFDTFKRPRPEEGKYLENSFKTINDRKKLKLKKLNRLHRRQTTKFGHLNRRKKIMGTNLPTYLKRFFRRRDITLDDKELDNQNEEILTVFPTVQNYRDWLADTVQGCKKACISDEESGSDLE